MVTACSARAFFVGVTALEIYGLAIGERVPDFAFVRSLKSSMPMRYYVGEAQKEHGEFQFETAFGIKKGDRGEIVVRDSSTLQRIRDVRVEHLWPGGRPFFAKASFSFSSRDIQVMATLTPEPDFDWKAAYGFDPDTPDEIVRDYLKERGLIPMEGPPDPRLTVEPRKIRK